MGGKNAKTTMFTRAVSNESSRLQIFILISSTFEWIFLLVMSPVSVPTELTIQGGGGRVHL